MEITPGKIKRLRNLPAFKDWTVEQLEEYLRNKPIKERKARTPKVKEPKETEVLGTDADYDKRYNAKLNQMKNEYGVDMNDANDAENLRILVRLTIQLEDIDAKVRVLTKGKFLDSKQLKDFADYQRGLVGSVTDLQDKLGITRKARKEKQQDDIPQWMRAIRIKAKDLWDRETTAVKCNNCSIELARYWLNFPELALKVGMELECWNCHEKVVYVR